MERKGIACLLVLALAGPGSAWAAEEATLLQLGVPVVRELHAGEVHSYRLPLKAGDYARIEIVQEGVDVKVALRDPSGGQIVEIDSPTGCYSTEIASLVADLPGEYALDVKPFSSGAASRYRLFLVVGRPATQEDRERVAAERADLEVMPLQGGAESLEKARHAVDLWHAMGDSRSEALALTRLGIIQFVSGMSKESLATCSQALVTQRSLGDKDGAAESLNQIGKSNRKAGDRNGAIAAHEESMRLWEELGRPDRVAKALLNAGETHEAFSEMDAALASYERALTLGHQLGHRRLQALTLNRLGLLHTRLGQPQQALDELRGALDLARDTDLEAAIRNSLGTLYRDFGAPKEALDHFAAALQSFKTSGDTEKQAAAFNNLGNLLLKLGAPEEARELLQKALSLCRDRRNRATTLLGLSRADDQLGNSKEAFAHLDEALSLQKTVEDRAGEAETLRVRGFLFLETGEPARAREALTESVEIMEQSGLRSTLISARRGLARAQADLGDLDSARKGFEEARKQAEELDNVGEQALALAEAGRLEHEAGNLPAARDRLASAIDLIESFQSEIGGDSLRAQHFAQVRETYERYVDVLMQSQRASPDASLVAKAFEVAERSRARSLLDVLTRARVETRGSDLELADRELHLRLELNAKAAARVDLPPGPQREALSREIQSLSAEYQIAAARLTNGSGFAGLTQPSITVADVQGLLADDTVLLEYLLGEPRSYLWVVSRNGITPHELPARREIEAMARQVHELLSSPAERDTSLQRQALDVLSRAVIAPAIAGLGGKRLMIVADGALQYIPFAALPVSSTGSSSTQPLLAEHESILLPSAAVLKELRQARSERHRSPLSLAILADPVYGSSDLMIPPAPPKILPAVSRGPGLEQLSWSRREAEQIAAEAHGFEVLTALRYDATLELALSDRLSRFRMLHFATHGFIDSDHPQLSGLVLSRFDANGRPVDGFLRLQDIYSLHLQADLVVLSGCETGLGHDLRGEGLVGLTNGFLHAGASQVVASLWPVRDRAAAELMQRYYRAMFRDGLRPSAALRVAQLAMRDERTWRDPYFWAPFVAQGDWMAGDLTGR